ncbi:MAG: VOC family protein [Acidobacteriota bacterium]
MSAAKPMPGSISWFDLTVPKADEVRDFYAEVVGWQARGVDMKDGEASYEDYMMVAPNGAGAAGICWARGGNADLPPQWLVYITVEDLDTALESCRARGGDIITGPKDLGAHGRYAVIRDPAGAVSALFEGAG